MVFQIRCDKNESDHILIDLEKSYNGTLLSDNSYRYYKLVIPDDIKVNSSDLVFRVKELDSADIGKTDFSDPDIYVSKSNKYPKNLFEADYFSERYGEDFLSVPNSDIYGGKIFYFSIFCELKCAYQFTAILEPEFKIMENEVYKFSIKEGKSISLKFDQVRENIKELEFISYSSKMSSYKMFVSKKRNPSSQNTFTIIPSWIGGYYASVTKNSFNFCSNCTYYILLEAEKGSAEINFMVKYENSINKIKTNEPIFSTLKPFNMHCYSIDVTDENKNQPLIIQTMLFSGSASLNMNAWKNPRLSGDEYMIEKFNFTNDILSENIKIITPEERKDGIIESGTFYICLRSFDYTSYLMKVFFGNQAEKSQKFNFLFTGLTLNGYLPPNSLTKYRAVEFSRNADIFFDLQVHSGSLKMFGYVCEEAKKCRFNNENFDALRGDLIESEKTPNGYRVSIPDKINTCHRKLEKNDTYENEVASLPCAIFAIIKCEGDQACSYNIISTHTNSTIKLIERKPHYQLVSYNETDSYKITIDDETITNVTIILNSNSGDADLYVTGITNKFDSRSINEGYIPDVIRIEKSLFMPKITGEYLVKVKGSTFASYSIYYYTHKIDENKNYSDDNISNQSKNKTQVVNLELGKIIKGYIKEKAGKINYKLYSFNPKLLNDNDSLDIRITITPEHSEFQMYVLFDINDIKFQIQKSNVILDKYLWKSSTNNEIVISKNDPNYKKDSIYYIFIIPLHHYFLPFLTSNTTDSINNQFDSFFYLGVTLEDLPFVIQEGIPSSITLDTNYSSQNYWFYHYNISNPVYVSLNVFYGRVDIYIDLWWSEDISSSATAIKALDTDSNYISITPEKMIKMLNENLKNLRDYNNTIVPLYILIKKSSFVDAQYLLAIKSQASIPEKLQPELVRSEILLSGEYKKYFIHLRANDTGIFNIIFKSGYGDLYINIFNSDDYLNANLYPNATSHALKANDYFRGKMLSINENILAPCLGSCKVLISVHGNNLGYSEDRIEYSLSYYKSALKINQNQPYHNTIQEGELQFFRVYFGEKTKNVYISLTNMNGDADLYVNYGSSLPTFEKSDWNSYTARNEFINFDKNDNFFVENKLEDISGEYTIMINGFKKTSYSLYISSHPKKIIPLNDNSPASCITKKDEEYCYFRYDDIYDYDTVITDSMNSNFNNMKKDLDVVILTHFIYGSGQIFAKLYDDTDYDILQDFPDEKNFDYSNLYSNRRNLLNIEIKKINPKYNANSTVLISVKCITKCFFDLLATRQYDSTIKYLDDKKENIFYFYKSDTSILLIYNYYRQGELNYNLKALSGKANVYVFTNDTISNTENKLDDFISNSEEKNSIDIHKKIGFAKIKSSQNIYFKIKPLSDFAFSIKITYQHDWQEIKVGKVENYVIDPNRKRFFGYFNVENEFDSLFLTITPNNKNLTAYCYVKYISFDKTKVLNTTDSNYMENIMKTAIIPNEIDSDYKANNLNLYSIIALKLPKLDKSKIKNSIIKVLFSVALFDHSDTKDIKDIKLKIKVIPKVNNVTISNIPSNTIEYVSLEGFEENSSIHIYDLKRDNQEDDVCILEISSCVGAIDVLVSSKVIHSKKEAYKDAIIPYSIENTNGRTVYIFKNINADNLYLLINAKQVISKDCQFELKDNKLKCDKKVSELLINYIFTKSSNLLTLPHVLSQGITIDYDIINSNSVNLKWKPLVQALYNFNFYDTQEQEDFNLAPVEYNVYISESINDFLYMDSVCYLNLLTDSNNPKLTIKINTKDMTAKIPNLTPGKKYFINILAKNIYSRDIYAYKSIEVITRDDQFSPILIGGVALGVLVLLVLLIHFYRKYVYTKKVLNYEIQDVRNLSSITKDVSELRDMSQSVSNRRYENLNEDVSQI